MTNPVHAMHAGPRLAVPALAGALAATALSIVLTFAQFTGWWVPGVFVLAEIAVYQSFSVLVRRRWRDLALLRCLGASRARVFTGVLVEAAWAGLFGAVIGLGSGTLLLDTYRLDDAMLVFVLGVAGTVAAAVIPAYRAGRVPPSGPPR